MTRTFACWAPSSPTTLTSSVGWEPRVRRAAQMSTTSRRWITSRTSGPEARAREILAGMWGTYLLDVYRKSEAREMRGALETLLGPESGTGFSSGGVYIFWRPDTRQPLYVGIAGDLPVRFGQHNELNSCPSSGCKREQINEYFAQHEELGYTVLAMSSLSQVSTSRQRKTLDLDQVAQTDLVELNETLSAEAFDEIRALEGRLIAWNRVRFGHIPPWNTSPGRIPPTDPDADDGVMPTAVGAVDILLQGRRTIRQLAASNLSTVFEAHLHGVRLQAVARGIVSGHGLNNELIREQLRHGWAAPQIRDEILRCGYLDQRCPVTVGPVADNPPHAP
jgi:hypothetical protein